MPRALNAKLVLGPAATAADDPITRIRAAAARTAVAPTSTRVRSRVIVCMDCLLDLGGSFIVGTPRSLDAVRDAVSRPSQQRSRRKSANRIGRRRRTDNESA